MNITKKRGRPSIRWPMRRLHPLISFINEQDGGIDLTRMACTIGMSTKAVSAMMTKDDMRLSKASYIAKCYGFHLHLAFPPMIRVTGILCERKRTFINAGELTGLANYIQDRYGSIDEASRHLPCSRSVLDTAFSTGDILISRLITITQTFGITVKWEWVPLQKEN